MSRFVVHSIVFSAALLLVASGAANAATPAGKWVGSWSSHTSGHRGPVRARIRKIDDDSYRAVFVGRFAGVVPFIYPATLDRVQHTRHCYVSSQRLPLMGTYRMTATIVGDRFDARYRSRDDSGRFRMRRR